MIRLYGADFCQSQYLLLQRQQHWYLKGEIKNRMNACFKGTLLLLYSFKYKTEYYCPFGFLQLMNSNLSAISWVWLWLCRELIVTGADSSGVKEEPVMSRSRWHSPHRAEVQKVQIQDNNRVHDQIPCSWMKQDQRSNDLKTRQTARQLSWRRSWLLWDRREARTWSDARWTLTTIGWKEISASLQGHYGHANQDVPSLWAFTSI